MNAPAQGQSPNSAIRDDQDFSWIDLIAALLAAAGVVLFCFFVASRIVARPIVDSLPDWLQTGFGKTFAFLTATASAVTILTRRRRNAVLICSITAAACILFFVGIWGATLVLRPRDTAAKATTPSPQESAPAPQDSTPAPETVPPAPDESQLHTKDKLGNDYITTWQAPGNCVGAAVDDRHRCVFQHTQVRIGGSNDPFDHWEIAVRTPGVPYDVDCGTGGWELNDPVGQRKGTIEGDWAVCKGWINGGADPVTIKAKYKLAW